MNCKGFKSPLQEEISQLHPGSGADARLAGRGVTVAARLNPPQAPAETHLET